MSASGLRPPLRRPWWWATEDGPIPERPGATALLHHGGTMTIRCGPGTTATELRAAAPAALGRTDTVVLELGQLPAGTGVARAVAALRVRLLVRGLRVRLHDPSAEVLAEIGGAPDARYRVVEDPSPACG